MCIHVCLCTEPHTLSGEFVMEYCGEVCTLADFEARKVEYVRDKRRHYYFMSLRADEVRRLVSQYCK